VADVIAAGDVHQRFLTCIAARDDFAALVRRQLTRTAEQHAMCALARLRSLPVQAMIRWRSNSASPPSTQDQSAVRRLFVASLAQTRPGCLAVAEITPDRSGRPILVRVYHADL
jgi:hypothetical protein